MATAIKTIKNIFGNPIENLQKDSKGILDIFTKTVTDLKNVNARVDTEASEREAEKKRIEDELVKLSTIKTDNEKVISKIEKIFE